MDDGETRGTADTCGIMVCPWGYDSPNWKREHTTPSERLANAKEAKEALMSPSTIAQLKADMKAVFKRLDAWEPGPNSDLAKHMNNKVREIHDFLHNLDDKTDDLESSHCINVDQISKLNDRLNQALETGPLSDDLQRLKERITTVANRLYALQTRLATACFEENH